MKNLMREDLRPVHQFLHQEFTQNYASWRWASVQNSTTSLRQIATYCPELRELDLKGCYNTTDDGISSIVRGCQRLRLLDISTSYTKQMLLSDRSLVTIATHCKNLRQLNIQKNDLMSLDGVRYFCDRCPLPITVILTSRCHDIQRTDILSTDKSDNAFKMVKSNCFYVTSRFGNFHEVLLHNSNEDIFQ